MTIRNSMIQRTCAALTLAASVIGFSASAHALTNGSQSGIACQSIFGPTSGFSALSRSQSGLSNSAGTSMIVMCPIQRVNALSTSGLSKGYVDFYQGASGGTCNLTAADEYGNTIDSSSATASAGVGSREISFGANVNVSDAWGFYALICSLPGSSTLHSYQWAEN